MIITSRCALGAPLINSGCSRTKVKPKSPAPIFGDGHPALRLPILGPSLQRFPIAPVGIFRCAPGGKGKSPASAKGPTCVEIFRPPPANIEIIHNCSPVFEKAYRTGPRL